MKQLIAFIFTVLAPIVPVCAQEHKDYRSCVASLTYLNSTERKNKKLPGTTIALANYSHQLEIRSALPVDYLFLRNYETSSLDFDLKLRVALNKMQRHLTSESVSSATGILQLNHLSKQVSVQYRLWPEDTENTGEMNISLLLSFNLADFFPDEFADKPLVFLINDGYVNRQ
jgi:hypothetical protein